MTDSPMLEALHAGAPDAQLAGKLSLYGQFIGSWALDIDHHVPGGPTFSAPAEWHFGWVLGGRAIQDIWMFPSRSFRVGKPAEPWHRQGTTFRWYDATIDAWHITYFDPSHANMIHQIGRAAGNDIVQMQTSAADLKFLQNTPQTRSGTSNRRAALASWISNALCFPKFARECAATYCELRKAGISSDVAGVTRRWRFTDIAGDTFRWIGDISWDRGASWTLEMEMRARRRI